jgi:cell division protein FtsB
MTSWDHTEELEELQMAYAKLQAENEKLRQTIELLNHAANSEEYPTSYFRVCGMREILENAGDN